jgi:hypothetical protein
VLVLAVRLAARIIRSAFSFVPCVVPGTLSSLALFDVVGSAVCWCVSDASGLVSGFVRGKEDGGEFWHVRACGGWKL